jgi:hypothetical protein
MHGDNTVLVCRIAHDTHRCVSVELGNVLRRDQQRKYVTKNIFFIVRKFELYLGK